MPLPPPARATLMPVVCTPACPPCPAPLPQHTEASGKLAPQHDASDDGEIPVVAELTNAVVAGQLSAFIDWMKTPRNKVGIAAFLLFSFVYRRRVAIWFHTKRHDIVDDYAPWANEFITEWAPVEAVSCGCVDGALREHGDQLHRMGHWVAALPDTGDGGPDTAFFDLEDEEFYALYLSLGRIIEWTEAKGDCGFDAMCMMAGMPRTLQDEWKSACNLQILFSSTRGIGHLYRCSAM